ncbi:MAG: FAD:protein FMN transferase [Verrucomicrobiae bacterium]|nr:FAD:protein FMN transferase [Verrucomicrobiae bacterium]
MHNTWADRRGWSLILWLVAQVALAADLPVWTWGGETMGSKYRISVVAPPEGAAVRERVQQEVAERLREINRQMSHYLPESELSQFNRAPAGKLVPVSPELATVIRFAVRVGRESGGAFDLTLAPLINLWGFGEQGPALALPSEEAIAAARALVDWRAVEVTTANALRKTREGLSLNLSGLAKGYAVDEIWRVLQRHGLTNVYVSIAGEIRVSGHSPRGGSWKIGISAPLELWREHDPMAAMVELRQGAVSTSGDYQKFVYDAQGRRLSHILDPRTGRPVQHALGSVTVVAPEGMQADALSTTLFVLGVEEGLKFVEGWSDAAALFIVREAEGPHFKLVPSRRWARLTGGVGAALPETSPKE